MVLQRVVVYESSDDDKTEDDDRMEGDDDDLDERRRPTRRGVAKKPKMSVYVEVCTLQDFVGYYGPNAPFV